MGRRRAFTKKRQAQFLEVLADTGNVSEAARQVGMSRQWAYDFKDGREEKDLPGHPEFAELWEAAEDEFLDAVDREIVRRAVPGIKRLKEKRKLDKDGNLIEVIKEATTYHSDRLLEFIAKNRHPNYQAPIKVEQTGAEGGPIRLKAESDFDMKKLSDEQLLQLQDLREVARKSEDDAAG